MSDAEDSQVGIEDGAGGGPGAPTPLSALEAGLDDSYHMWQQLMANLGSRWAHFAGYQADY